MQDTKMPNKSFKRIITQFVNGYNHADFPSMESTLAEDLKAHITNAEGGVNLWEGRNNFMEGIRAFDLEKIKPQLTITQLLEINPDQGMVMIEVKAERKGKNYTITRPI